MAKTILSLPDRIKAIQEEIEKLIDERAEAERQISPGIPFGVLRNMITARSGGCACEAWLQIAKEEA
jgi:hypothetical protein